MNHPYTAQCPSCHAELNLAQADMERANGDVICGNCKHSFYSPNHLLKGFYSSHNEPQITPSGRTASPAVHVNNDVAAIDSLLPSPSRYSAYKRRKRISRSFLTTVNVLLFLFLVFQLLWLKFDEWAVKENLRPVYAFLCSIDNLQCRLPAWIEPDSLMLQDLEVLLKNNSLYEMKALLVNRDDGVHLFPWINIEFTDINDISIASGRFSPYQYLLPHETDSMMRVGGSYEVLLEVRKPQHPVVNYEMRLIAVAP